MCTPQWVRDLANKQRGPAFATSPEGTWRHLIEALARADRQEALNCYSIESRAKVQFCPLAPTANPSLW